MVIGSRTTVFVSRLDGLTDRQTWIGHGVNKIYVCVMNVVVISGMIKIRIEDHLGFDEEQVIFE